MSFKANFLLWTLVELLWFSGQILFIEVIFAHVEQLGDWSKWRMMILIATHQIAAQLFQAVGYLNVTQLPELIRTGKLDLFLTLPLDSQFLVSTRQFGFDNLLNALLGMGLVGYSLNRLDYAPSPLQIGLYLLCLPLGAAIHYSIFFALSSLSFWIVRAQGLVYGYFNLFNIGRYPESVFQGAFRFIFTWVIPVLWVANIPARLLTELDFDLQKSTFELLKLGCAAAFSLLLSRWIWTRALSRYSSASS